jgi:hypothetical protein
MSTRTSPARGMEGVSSSAADAGPRAQDEAQKVAGQAQDSAQTVRQTAQQ